MAISSKQFQSQYPIIGSTLITVFLGSMALVVLTLIISGLSLSFQSDEKKKEENILDEDLVSNSQEPSLGVILKNIPLLYPIVFKEEYQKFMDTLELVKSSPKDYQEIVYLFDSDFFYDYEEFHPELEASFFEEYAIKNGFILSFLENYIAEDDHLRIYNFVKEKLNIEIKDMDDILSNRKHGDGFQIIEKQVIKIQEYLNLHGDDIICIYTNEFIYNIFLAKKKDYAIIKNLKYPLFWNPHLKNILDE